LLGTALIEALASVAQPAAPALVQRPATRHRGRLIGGLSCGLRRIGRLGIERPLGLGKPGPAPLARPKLGWELVAARLAEALVLGLVGRLRLSEDLARDPLVVEVRLATGIRGELRAVDRDHPGADQPRLRAQSEHRAEQPRERRLVAGEKARDRRVVRDPVGCDHPVGDVLATVDLDPARGALLGRVGIEQQRDHHRGLISGAAVPI